MSAREMLAALSLPERLWGVSPATFSGGEKQRVNLARGLLVRPRLLLDEPTASLDPATSERVVRLIEALKQEGVAMLAIFHQPELVERLADHVVELQPPTQSTPLEDIA
jgi:alpha-D-ribose 1-methylphosphonate 5-triphosphate synthase subunit PhnL